MQKLRDSEIHYRRLFEAAQDGILILNAETGMIEDVNPYLIKMLGYSREEFVEKRLWEVGAFKDIEASQDAFEALQENEYIRYEDLPLKTKNGQLIQVEFVSNVYLVGGEKVIQCNIRDITEHRQIIAALQGKEKKYHDLINQSPDGYFIIELSGKILTVNKAMCKELEFSEEEFLSMNIWDIIPEQYLDQYKERLKKILKGESLRDAAEYEVRGKNGKNHYVEVLSAPRYSGKDIIGFQGIARDITACKRADGALKESEERLHAVLNSAPITIFATDKKGVFTVNEGRGLQRLGMKPGENVGTSAFELYRSLSVIEPTGKVTTGEDIIHRVLGGEIVTGVTELKDMCFDNQFSPLLDAEGQVVGLVGVATDITARKQAESALQASEAKYRRLFEAAQDGVLILDSRTGMIEDVNPYLIKMLGYSREEFIKKKLWEVGAFRDVEASKEAFEALQEKEYIRYDDLPLKTKDGRLIQVEFVSNVYLVDNEKVIQCNIRDITDRKRMEDVLLKSEQRYRILFDSMMDGIYRSTHAGKFVDVNPAMVKMFGYSSKEEMLAVDIKQELYFTSEERGSHILDTGQEEIETYRMRRKDGSEIWVEDHGYYIHDEQGRPTFHEGMLRDITERKRAEQQIQRQLAHLTALSAIDRVIASNFDLKLSLSEILNHVTMELEVDAADILILNPNSQMLEYGAERGFRTQAVREANVRLGESHAGRVAMERQLTQIPDLRNEPDNLLLTALLAGEDFVCYYGVPLITKGQVKGVLEVFHRVAFKPDVEWFDFLNTLAGQAAIAIENATLFENLQRSNLDLMLAYDATIEGWSAALDLRDKETEGHSQRVTKMAVNLARTLGLSEAELVQVRWGALLHDIGKMGVPDEILHEPGSLTDEEWVAMKKHPTFAYEMLSPIRYLRLALDIPYCHHEKWDGSGYPRGLMGEQIPLVARIFAVVDVWDALTSDRPYRAAWSKEKALEYIRASSGMHFDPQVVDAFLQMPK